MNWLIEWGQDVPVFGYEFEVILAEAIEGWLEQFLPEAHS